MIDYLKGKMWSAQTTFLAERGDKIWEDLCDAYGLYEEIDGMLLPWLSTSIRYHKLYCHTVLRNVAAMHAVQDSGQAQVIKVGGKWMLCDPAKEAPRWELHRATALEIARGA